MKLTDLAIERIKENVACKPKLALELDRAVSTIERIMLENDDNNLLTTVGAVRVIETETGLKQSEILAEA